MKRFHSEHKLVSSVITDITYQIKLVLTEFLEYQCLFRNKI